MLFIWKRHVDGGDVIIAGMYRNRSGPVTRLIRITYGFSDRVALRDSGHGVGTGDVVNVVTFGPSSKVSISVIAGNSSRRRTLITVRGFLMYRW